MPEKPSCKHYRLDAEDFAIPVKPITPDRIISCGLEQLWVLVYTWLPRLMMVVVGLMASAAVLHVGNALYHVYGVIGWLMDWVVYAGTSIGAAHLFLWASSFLGVLVPYMPCATLLQTLLRSFPWAALTSSGSEVGLALDVVAHQDNAFPWGWVGATFFTTVGAILRKQW